MDREMFNFSDYSSNHSDTNLMSSSLGSIEFIMELSTSLLVPYVRKSYFWILFLYKMIGLRVFEWAWNYLTLIMRLMNSWILMFEVRSFSCRDLLRCRLNTFNFTLGFLKTLGLVSPSLSLNMKFFR